MTLTAVALSLVSCETEPARPPAPPDIVYGAARPAGDKLEVTLTDRGVPTVWPDACTTLKEEEIRAILPQAAMIQRTPEPIKFLPSFKVRPDGSFAGGHSLDAPRGSCVFGFDLPSEYAEQRSTSAITVTLTAVGSPEAIAEYYDDRAREHRDYIDFAEVGAVWGAEACFLKIEGAHCRNGRFYFEVKPWTTRWRLGQQEGEDKLIFWRDKVVPHLVTTLTARLS
ncbi:hypothetical protein [Nocardia sp. CS682]|uniref:hypothetical protein n=1 Tax=Nocardia sp. CS682 TaxID=1047172 RepID=UPI001074F04F|nr:hypothetical protein [Nocardia sp. CS682]